MMKKNCKRKSLALLLIPTLFAMTGCTNESTNEKFRIAISVSPFTDSQVNKGIRFEDNAGNKAASVAELQKLYMAHGANEVYVRIATDRYSLGGGTDHSLELAIERAKLAVELGLPLNPEIALFKTYGDVAGQPVPDFGEYPELQLPGPWNTLKVDEMIPVLKQYGALVARELTGTGAKINVWNIGNEVDFGTAGVAVRPAEGSAVLYQAPDGIDPEIGKQDVISLLKMDVKKRNAWLGKYLWPHQARLMNAVRTGILSVVPDAKFSTHIAQGANPEFAVAFYKAMLKGGFKVDVAGFSLYPTSDNTPPSRIEAFKSTIEAVHGQIGLPVFLAEFAYPAGSIDDGPYGAWGKNQDGAYELTPEGQASILRDLTAWGVEKGLCGIRPWAPDYIDPYWEELSFFALDASDKGITGKARPVIDSIYMGLQDSQNK